MVASSCHGKPGIAHIDMATGCHYAVTTQMCCRKQYVEWLARNPVALYLSMAETTCRGLIQEKYTRVCNKADADTDATPLATRDTSCCSITIFPNHGIYHLSEALQVCKTFNVQIAVE